MTFPNPYKERKAFESYVARHPADAMSNHALGQELLAWGEFTGVPVPVGKLDKAENWTGWLLIAAGFPLALASWPVALGAACAGAYLKIRDWMKGNDRKTAEKRAGERLAAVAAEHVKRLKQNEELLAAMAKPERANGELTEPASPPAAPDIAAPPDIAAAKPGPPERKPPPTGGGDPDPPRT